MTALLLLGLAHGNSCWIPRATCPLHEGLDVAVNAAPVVVHEGTTWAPLPLTGPDGAVAADVESHPDHSVITPRAPLQPNTTYRLGDCAFTTDSHTDDQRPGPPLLRALSRPLDHLVSDLGTVDLVPARREAVVLTLALDPVPGAIYELDIATRDDFADAVRLGSDHPTFVVGDDLCGVNFPFDPLQDYILRVRTRDAAGLTSPWQTFRSPVPRWADASPSWEPVGLMALLWLGTAGLALIPRVRRRRR